MGPGVTEDNFSYPLLEMLDQIFEETLEEVTNQNTTVASESDHLQVESQVKVNEIWEYSSVLIFKRNKE